MLQLPVNWLESESSKWMKFLACTCFLVQLSGLVRCSGCDSSSGDGIWALYPNNDVLGVYV